VADRTGAGAGFRRQLLHVPREHHGTVGAIRTEPADLPLEFINRPRGTRLEAGAAVDACLCSHDGRDELRKPDGIRACLTHLNIDGILFCAH
jgi:hypothetical protein